MSTKAGTVQISYIGSKPVQRYELQGITTGARDFQVNLPAGLPTIDETQHPDNLRHARH